MHYCFLQCHHRYWQDQLLQYASALLFVFSVSHIVVVSLVKNISCLGGYWMFKVNNRNTRRRCEICSKLTIKTPERYFLYPVKISENLLFFDVFRGYRRRRSGVSIVNFGHILHLVPVFLLLILSS